MSRPAPKSPLEKKIQADIEAELGAEPDLLLLRNSCGAAEYLDEKTGKSWHVPYGLGTGSPDLVGLLRFRASKRGVLGLWFCLEVKQVGKDATDEQKKCHEIWRRFGAIVCVVHSVHEAREALRTARHALRLLERETA